MFFSIYAKGQYDIMRSVLPPAHTLDGSAAKISMQDFLMIYKKEKSCNTGYQKS